MSSTTKEDDRFVIIKRSLIEEEEKASYSSVGYFRNTTVCHNFLATYKCEPATVLYVCDTAFVSDFQNRYSAVMVVNSNGQASEITGQREKEAVSGWLDHSSAVEILMVAMMYAKISHSIMVITICRCLRSSLSKIREDIGVRILLERYIDQVIYNYESIDWTEIIRDIERRKDKCYYPFVESLIAAFYSICEGYTTAALQAMIFSGLDISEYPQIIRSAITEKMFLLSMVE